MNETLPHVTLKVHMISGRCSIWKYLVSRPLVLTPGVTPSGPYTWCHAPWFLHLVSRPLVLTPVSRPLVLTPGVMPPGSYTWCHAPWSLHLVSFFCFPLWCYLLRYINSSLCFYIVHTSLQTATSSTLAGPYMTRQVMSGWHLWLPYKGSIAQRS